MTMGAISRCMAKAVKFSSKIEEAVLKELRVYASESQRNVSGVLTDAVREYLQRVCVRPVFKSAADEVLRENEELLRRLAK